ncbi:MAG: polyprenyl diphosphate synthase, partial [Armatimonadota bacterium]
EIVDAARYAAEMVRRNEIEPDDIDEQLISGLMYHPELPDPDLLIRTAGEMRISNFLLWQCAYTELYVTQTLWPDFTKDDLVKAIADYQKRTRKFGAVVES